MTFAPHDPDLDPEELDLDAESEEDPSPVDKAKAREDSLSKLESTGGNAAPSSPVSPDSDQDKTKPTGLKEKRRTKVKKPDAIIILKEEKASTFHDFLKYVYPQ